jgi:hypothetical protein
LEDAAARVFCDDIHRNHARLEKDIMLKTLALLIFTAILLLLVYWFVARPWHESWGATPAESGMTLPGEDLLPGGRAVSTRAITIHAPAAAIYPWLLQIGQGRGGFYSYDWLENLFGCDIHSANRILPELQHPQVGDAMRLAPYPALPYYHFALLETDRAVILRSIDPASGQPASELWMFTLHPLDSGTTRLVVRHHSLEQPNRFAALMTRLIFDPMAFIMERGMMRGIRARAEG